MIHSNLKIGFIIFSLFLSPVVFAQMDANQAPQPAGAQQTTTTTTKTQTTAAEPTTATGMQAEPVDTSQTIETRATTTTEDPSFFRKIWAPVQNLFLRITDALGITTNKAAAPATSADRATRTGTPGRHAWVYMRQSGGTGTSSDTTTKTDAGVIRQTTDTSSSVNLIR